MFRKKICLHNMCIPPQFPVISSHLVYGYFYIIKIKFKYLLYNNNILVSTIFNSNFDSERRYTMHYYNFCG